MPAETLRSFDPATGDVVWEGAIAGPAEISAAMASASAALPGWSSTPLDVRLGVLSGFKTQLEDIGPRLAEMISRETGKPAWEGKAEVASMVAKIAASIAAHTERTGEKRSPLPFGEAVLRHHPHGVMAVLGPYNFPGHLPNGHIVPALLAGNTVVFKPSELTPGTGALMAEAWAASGLPAGVFSIVQGGRATGEALLAHDIDGLLFTGSAGAGAHFRRIFADRPKVMLALELGGNNPLVVWDAADVEEAASVVVQSAFITTGQRCSCARRLIIPQGAFGEALVDAVAALAGRLVVGAWNASPEPFMGPLISDAAAAAAHRAVAALDAPAIRAFSGIAGQRDAFVTPAIYDVTGRDVPDEEIFAPVMQVRRVGSFERTSSSTVACVQFISFSTRTMAYTPEMVPSRRSARFKAPDTTAKCWSQSLFAWGAQTKQ